MGSTEGDLTREAACVVARQRPARFVKPLKTSLPEAPSREVLVQSTGMEDTEDAQDAWTKPAATFKIKRTKSTGRPSFSNISKQNFTSNSVKRMNPFGTVNDPNRGEACKRPRLEDTLGRC